MKHGCIDTRFVKVCSVVLFFGSTTPWADDSRESNTDNLQKPTISAPQKSEDDAAARSAALKRLQDLIRQQTEKYQERPRKRFIGNSREYRFVKYEEEWRQKIERIGNANYPPEARGKLYGNVRLSVSIKSDGTVESISLERSSGHEILDRGAVRIVELAKPFAPFPPEISKDTDLLIITYTWFFTSRDNISAE